MSTRSSISYYNPTTKRYYTVYCHFNGYLEGVGLMLYKHYTDYDKVKRLVSLGGVSHIEPNIDPAPGKTHSFDSPQKDVCVFYTRDRGEDWKQNQPQVYTNRKSISEEWDLDYNYLYKDGKWYVQRGFRTTTDWMLLEDQLKEHEIIPDDSKITEENVKKSVDVATESDYVAKVNTIEIKNRAVKFVEMLNNIAKNTSGEILNAYFDKDSNVDVVVDYDMDLTYGWDPSMIDFLKELLDLYGLKSDLIEMRIQNNDIRYYSIIGIESK